MGVFLELPLEFGVAFAQTVHLRAPLVHQTLQTLHLLQQRLDLASHPAALLPQCCHLLLQLGRPGQAQNEGHYDCRALFLWLFLQSPQSLRYILLYLCAVHLGVVTISLICTPLIHAEAVHTEAKMCADCDESAHADWEGQNKCLTWLWWPGGWGANWSFYWVMVQHARPKFWH